LHRFVCGCGCPKTGFHPNGNPNPIADPNHDNFSDNQRYLDIFPNPFANPNQAYLDAYPDSDSFSDANSNLHATAFKHPYPDPDFYFYRYFAASASQPNLDQHSNRYSIGASTGNDRAAQRYALADQRNPAFSLS
jgi:hypothetical protein